MKQESFTTIILEPEEGNYLTQSAEDIDILNRSIASRVALGRGSTPEDWKEISAEEAESYRKAQEKAREDKMKEENEIDKP